MDDTHDKVYALNRQMCDLDIPLRNPIKPLSEETAQDLIGKLEKIGKEWASKKNEIVESIFGNITNEKSNIMKEKKTKKMTRAEAFEYFKGKRAVCDNFNSAAIQRKFFEVGIKWRGGSTKPTEDSGVFLFVDLNGCLTHCNSRAWFDTHEYEVLSADDILSIEIVDEKSGEEDALDLISTIGARLTDVLRRMEGHKHIVITEDDVILYDEGMSLFHSDPF